MKVKKDGSIDKRSTMERTNKYPITDDLVDFIKLHIEKTDKELLSLIGENPEWQWVNFTALRHVKYRYRIVKQHQVAFTEEERQYIRDNYLIMGDVEMAKNLPNHTFKSVHKLRRVTLGLRRPKEELTALRKINAKKGTDSRDRMIETGTFYNPRYRYEGEIYRTETQGDYWLIKPDNGRLSRQVFYHRWLWQKEVGPIPKGYKVRFKNGVIPDDYTQITIDILECVSANEHAQKSAANLSDRYVAGRLFYKSQNIDLNALKKSGIIEVKREEIKLKRELKKFEENGKQQTPTPNA